MNRNTVLTVLITCFIFANVFLYSKIFTDTILEPSYVSESDVPVTENEGDMAEDAGSNQNVLPPDYKYITANLADTYAGTLVLVNSTHPFVFENTPTVVPGDAVESVYYNKTTSYSVRDINVSLNTVATAALNKMLDDFYAHMGNKKNIILTQGHRTYEEQQAMFDLKVEQLGADQAIAQKPGDSEHHTGLAMDISTYEGGIMGTFTGEGDYAWIHRNAHKYGFILRYPAGKEAETGIDYESWHFRYVGIPHAEYMYTNDLTLEKYIEYLALYPFESVHLPITDTASGDMYEVYSVPVTADGARVPVPSVSDDSGEYTLSGDNNGHVIVTVKKSSEGAL